MSTMLSDRGSFTEVSTVSSPGKRRHIGRGLVRVPKGDTDAVKAEIIRQADKLRKSFGVDQKPEGPVD